MSIDRLKAGASDTKRLLERIVAETAYEDADDSSAAKHVTPLAEELLARSIQGVVEDFLRAYEKQWEKS